MVKLNKIYTRTGDDGTTGLVDGSRTRKDSARMAAIGDVDELNSAIGIVVAELDAAQPDDGEPVKQLSTIQNDLFDLGADLATPGTDFEPSEMELRIVAGQVERIETQIDEMNDTLEPLASFILPGGSKAAASAHLARAICRRAERTIVAASHEDAINPLALSYINRLSDYLFVLCRYMNREKGDPLWVPGASR